MFRSERVCNLVLPSDSGEHQVLVWWEGLHEEPTPQAFFLTVSPWCLNIKRLKMETRTITKVLLKSSSPPAFKDTLHKSLPLICPLPGHHGHTLVLHVTPGSVHWTLKHSSFSWYLPLNLHLSSCVDSSDPVFSLLNLFIPPLFSFSIPLEWRDRQRISNWGLEMCWNEKNKKQKSLLIMMCKTERQ